MKAGSLARGTGLHAVWGVLSGPAVGWLFAIAPLDCEVVKEIAKGCAEMGRYTLILAGIWIVFATLHAYDFEPRLVIGAALLPATYFIGTLLMNMRDGR
jgi:hypothetical protein